MDNPLPASGDSGTIRVHCFLHGYYTFAGTFEEYIARQVRSYDIALGCPRCRAECASKGPPP